MSEFPRTKFERIKHYKEGSTEISHHSIDQLVYFRKLSNREIREVVKEDGHEEIRYSEVPEEKFLNAITFTIPSLIRREPFSPPPAFVTVYGNGDNLCGVFLSGGGEPFESIVYRDSKFDFSGEHSMDVGVLLDRLPTSEVCPFLRGGDYATYGKRIYDIDLDYNGTDKLRIVSNSRPARSEDDMEIWAISDRERQTTPVSKIVRSVDGWVWDPVRRIAEQI